MRIKPKFAGLFWLTAVVALLAIAVGTSTADASEFKAPGGFPVTLLGEGVGLSTFLSEGLNSVTCHNSHSKGSVTSSTDIKATITYLTGCELVVEKSSIGKFKEACPTITTKELLIVPLSKLNEGIKTGLLVLPATGTELAAFTCTGSNKAEVKVKGSVICEPTPIDTKITKGKNICKAATPHGTQEFTLGTNPSGTIVKAGLTTETTIVGFKTTEKDSQETTENVTYAKEVEQTGELEPLPNETTIEGFGKTIVGSEELPVINWGVGAPMTTKGCKGGKVVVIVEAENSETHKIESRESTLAESPAGSGKFAGDTPIMKPLHGKAKMKITVSGCEHVGEDIVVIIIIYIDPSGTVVDGNHEDAPVWEATVTLLSSPTETGTYTAVENDSEVMSEANRLNPDLSRENGGFGWDTIEGWYKIEATRTGCGTASTAAFHVPPPQEKLLITLHCEGEQWKLGGEAGGKPQLAVTAPATKCTGNVRVENVSFGTALVTVLKETGIECVIKKKGCEAKRLNKWEKCETELERPGTKPEYELEVEWKGEKFTRKFPV